MGLVRLPVTVIVILRVNVQELEGSRIPPVNVNFPSPGIAVNVPPQVPTSGFAGFATIIPAGIVSTKATPVKGTLLGLIN